jgi:hypothetical protein
MRHASPPDGVAKVPVQGYRAGPRNKL